MLPALILSFFVMLVIGVPIAFAMGASAIYALVTQTSADLIIVAQRVYAGVDSFSLLAIPFFIIAGELMTVSRMTDSLVRLCNALLGHLRSGLAGVTVGACTLFSGISGSGSADTAAIGSVMIPQLVARGYPRGLAAAIVAVAGALGPIIPPSLLMIIYAAIAEQSVGRMFLSGIIPGVMIGGGLLVLLYVWNLYQGWELPERKSIDFAGFRAGLRGSLLPLGTPVIIVVGIVGGVFTVTEASAVAVVYALVAAYFYAGLTWAELRAVLVRAGLISSLSLFVIAMSAIFSWILAREQFPDQVIGLVTASSGGVEVIGALLVILALLILGIFVEPLPLIIIFTPVLVPLGDQLGYDPIHWALMMVMTMNIGGITPPVGSNLFIAASIARCGLKEIGPWTWPLTGIHVLAVLLVLAFPELALWIPRALMD